MRVGAVDRDHSAQLNHRRSHVGVEVEADGEGRVRPDRLAHPAEQFAFSILMAFSDHRAVKVEVDRIDRLRGDRADDLCADPIKRVVADQIGGFCARPEDGDQIGLPLRRRDEAAERDV